MLQHVMCLLGGSTRDERGATAIEYVLIAALMAAVVIAGIEIIGPGISTTFQNISDTITGANAGP